MSICLPVLVECYFRESTKTIVFFTLYFFSSKISFNFIVSNQIASFCLFLDTIPYKMSCELFVTCDSVEVLFLLLHKLFSLQTHNSPSALHPSFFQKMSPLFQTLNGPGVFEVDRFYCCKGVCVGTVCKFYRWLCGPSENYVQWFILRLTAFFPMSL